MTVRTLYVMLSMLAFTKLGAQSYLFKRLDVRQGLSHNQVNSIFQDNRGFLWLGTMSGLNRFDGNEIRVFRHNHTHPNSLSDNYITHIYELPDKKLWIGTRNGGNIYDPLSESFQRNTNNYLLSIGLPAGQISKIVKDKDANYWFLYQNLGGIFRFNTKDKKITQLLLKAAQPGGISSYDVADLQQDNNGHIWLVYRNGLLEKLNEHLQVTTTSPPLQTAGKSSESYSLFIDAENELWIYSPMSTNTGGIFHYQPLTDKLLHYSTQSSPIRLNSNIVTGITQDENNLLWIGTDHGGINLINKRTQTIRYIKNDPEDNYSVSQNSTYTIYKDNNNIIWLGTHKQGVSYYDRKLPAFNLFKHKISDPQSLPVEDINKFAEDAQGNLWIGTNGNGLLYFNPKNQTFKRYVHDPKDPNSLSSNIIVSLCVDAQNNLWVGTYFGGLNYFDGKNFKRFLKQPDNPNSILDNSVWDIMEDSGQNIWIGTLSGGVTRYSPGSGQFTHYHVEDGRSVHSNYITAMQEDKTGKIWFATSNGIDIFNPATGQFRYYGHDDEDSTTLSNNNVMSLLEDSKGRMWVGTREGLNLFLPDLGQFKIFRKEDGLPDNTILTILQDDKGSLWISTPNGLGNIRLIETPDRALTIQCTNYDEANGLQGREFNDKAAIKTTSGNLLFGGPYGFNMFKPDEFIYDIVPPKLVFTSLQIFNTTVTPGEKFNGHLILPESITETDHLELPYNQNVFSLSFTSIGTASSFKNHYKYKLEGFNNEWLTTDGSQRTITYTNIDPGKYKLWLTTAEDDPIKPRHAIQLSIQVLPPFWKTPLAYLIYFLIATGVLLFTRHLIIQKTKMRLNLAQQKKEAERIHELDMLKVKLFTNISHELRTPISLILSPAESLIQQKNTPEVHKNLQLIYTNARRLLGLVNQLLDFRKLEKKELRLYITNSDIVSFTREITASFSDIAERKKIDYSFNSTHKEIAVNYDPDKLERILFNLLSNAFKFTGENGNIHVNVNVDNIEKQVCIAVKDSGIGIPAPQQAKIFERYFQHNTPEGFKTTGTGIGLAISKEYAKLHGGDIRVESTETGGTCFTIMLPILSTSAKADLTETLSVVMSKQSVAEPDETKKKQAVLLVEDNDDIRFYIKDNLQQQYTIFEALNGKEGWDKAQELLPELIICDVTMPEMDGLTLCSKLKQDKHTSHIPVVLLTARGSEEQQLEGLRTGAIDYITKPFSIEMLLNRVKNILQHQEKMRAAFQQKLDINPAEISATPVDEDFITRAIAAVEKEISNTEFSVEDLSKAMLMSRVALYKKLLSLTGKAPLDFIRTIRMKRAAQLMEKSNKSVSEIAYEVGFSNPKYFTKFFKKEFDQLPSSYIQQRRKQ